MDQETVKMAFPSPWQTLGLLGIFIAFSIAISVLLGPFLGNDPGNMPAWFILVGTAVPMGGTIWIAQIWRGGGSFFLRSVPPHIYVLGVLLGMPVAGLAGILVEVLHIPDFLEEMLKDFLEKPGIFTFLAIVVAAPILEELLFRSVILGGFLRRYSPPKAIFWSALIFGVYHFNPAQVVGAFLIGLVLGLLFWRTRSVWPCIVLHAVNNGLGYWMLGKEELSEMTMRELLGSDLALTGVAVGCIGLAAAAYWMIMRSTASTADEFMPPAAVPSADIDDEEVT